MNKLLLNGTAIAGLALALTATPAAAEIDLGLGGHVSAYGIFANQDDGAGEAAAGLSDSDFQRETEIYFTGETTLDNGLTVGVEVQLEGGTKADQIDESYLYFSGDWGRVNLGSENGASYLLQVGAPAVDANFDGIDPEYHVVASGANGAVDTNRGLSYGMGFGGDESRGDVEKVTYLSPVFSGFQVGVSYTPDFGTALTGGEDDGVRAGFPTEATGADYNNGLEVAGRWAGEFEGVGVTVGAGWAEAQQEVATAANDDREQWNIGANVNFAGFTVGGAYFTDNEGADQNGDRETYVLGANYATGPYTVGASYLNTEKEVGVGVEDNAKRVLVGGSYAYGPGMSFNGAVHFYEIEDDAGSAADENDATVLTLGTVVKF